MTYNVHALLHLGNCARSLGPLWAHSAFVFEGGNGAIVHHVSAAKGLPNQILERVVMFQALKGVLQSPLVHSPEKKLCDDLLGYRRLQNALCVNGLSLLGTGRHSELSAEEQGAVYRRCGLTVRSVVEFERCVQDRQVFHSTAYRKPSKSDTTFVRTDTGCYVRIEKIGLLKETNSCVLICRPVIIADVPAVPPHIKECFLSHDGTRAAFLPAEIIDNCLFIDFMHEDKTFICDLPNKIERD